MNPNQIKEKIEVEDFLGKIRRYNEMQIECSPHTFFRLSGVQHKIYTCEELKKILLKEKPFLTGIQYNGNYAIFYKHKGKNLRMIIKMDFRKINIVTFYFIEEWQIPKT